MINPPAFPRTPPPAPENIPISSPVLPPEPSPSSVSSEPADTSALTRSIPNPGFTELLDVSDTVVASLSRDQIVATMDIQNPRSPLVVSTIDTPAFAEVVYRDDRYLYIADSRELRILDDTRTVVGNYSLENFWPSAFTIDNGIAYLASGSELMILNLEDPTHPRFLSRVSFTGRVPSEIIVRDEYAYILATLGGLNILDVRNPKNPTVVKVFPFESHTVGFKIRGEYAYLGRIVSIESTEQGYQTTSIVEIIDISQPASSSVIGSVEIPTDIRGLDLSGDYAFIIGSYPYRLAPIDIRSPAHPVLLDAEESIVGGADLQDIAVQDGYAFLADGLAGLRIVHIANPTHPQYMADVDLQGRAFSLYASDQTIYVLVEQKHFNLADIRDPEEPRPVYTERFTSSYGYTGVVVDASRAYFHAHELRIYDLTDPSHPRPLNEKSIEIDSIQVQGNYLYSTIGEIGLLVYDITDPSSPTSVSRTPFPIGIPRDLSVGGNWAVGISNIPYSINVFDISDPRNPVPGESYRYEKYPDRVTVKDNYAYVARGEEGVDILRIHPDGSLQLVKSIPTAGYAHRVAVQEDRAFIVRDGVDVYDIRSPDQPVFLYHLDGRGESFMADVSNGYVYLADGYAGVTSIKLPE